MKKKKPPIFPSDFEKPPEAPFRAYKLSKEEIEKRYGGLTGHTENKEIQYYYNKNRKGQR